MKKIKFFPGLLSWLHIVEIVLIVTSSICLMISKAYYWWAMPLVMFLVMRCIFFFFKNGYELFIKVKNNKLYVFRDFLFYKNFPINKKTIIYKTKVIGIEHGYFIANVSSKKPTVEKDGLTREDIFILVKEGNLKENGINYIFDEQDRLIACRENFYVTHNLLTNKNVIILNGNKSNYNFLRQFVEKEQFCGVTNTDKLHLEDLERQLKDKQVQL